MKAILAVGVNENGKSEKYLAIFGHGVGRHVCCLDFSDIRHMGVYGWVYEGYLWTNN